MFQPPENKFQARPPATTLPYNPLVGPQTYEPSVDQTKKQAPAIDSPIKSLTERKLKWEEEEERKVYKESKNIVQTIVPRLPLDRKPPTLPFSDSLLSRNQPSPTQPTFKQSHKAGKHLSNGSGDFD